MMHSLTWDQKNSRWAEMLSQGTGNKFHSSLDIESTLKGFAYHARNTTRGGKSVLNCCYNNMTRVPLGQFWNPTSQTPRTRCGTLKNLECWIGETSEGYNQTWCFRAKNPVCFFHMKGSGASMLTNFIPVAAPSWFRLPAAYGSCDNGCEDFYNDEEPLSDPLN